MPRPANYYEQKMTQTPAAVKPQAPAGSSSSSQSQPPASQQQNQVNYSPVNTRLETAKRFLPEMERTVLGLPPEEDWDKMSFWQKGVARNKAVMGLAVNMIKGIPAAIVKAPMNLSLGLLELTHAGMEKIMGPNPVMQAPQAYKLPVLGEVRGAKDYYDENIALGGNWLTATLAGAGSVAGDIAAGISGVEVASSTVKPKIVKIDGGIRGKDYRPLEAKQLTEIKSANGSPASVVEFAQNPKTTYHEITPELAARYGGTPNNIKMKVSPLGEGKAEYSIVRQDPSYLRMTKDYLQSKFGSKAVTGPTGPEVKLDTGIVEYNPAALAPVKSMADDMSVAPFETVTRPAAGSAVPALVENTKPMPQTPSLMSKPIKGFENEVVNEKQLGQIQALQKDRGMDDLTTQAITKVVTGKQNISDLSQAEAYQVSEAIRAFTRLDESTPGSGIAFSPKSYVQPARYWMEEVQRKANIPLYSDVYLPMETGARLKRTFTDDWQGQAREVFGKYAETKYGEERRAITQYIEGNKKVISENPAFTPEVKAELTKIGDWLQTTYKELFKQLGLESDRFLGQYSPKIRERGGIYNIYKTEEMPAEIKPFFEFERQGMLEPLQEDALALFDIYTNAIGKKMFIQGPVDRAIPIIDKAPIRIRKAANDYLQEKLGFQDATAEAMDTFSKKMSRWTRGFLPEDIGKQFVDFLMTNSYAGALGLPRIEPILRNYAQLFLTGYPELGPQYLAEGLRRFHSAGGINGIKNKGFLVDMGVPYGAELAQQTGRGPVGKALDKYKKFNQATMKPYSMIDTATRGPIFEGTVARFEDNWKAFREGQIDYKTFENNINMDGFSPTMQKVLREKFAENTDESLGQAVDLMAQDILDRSMFPYRKGAEGRAFYGLKGKLGLQFGQWSAEYASTLAKAWIGRKQWMKLIRWLGASTAIKRAAEESFNINVDKWVDFGPMTGFPLGPIGKIATSMVSGFNSAMSGMDEDVNRNWEDIVRSVKIYGGSLTGVGADKIKNFMQSIKRYEAGVVVSPDEKKPFGIWSSNGKLIRWASMMDLLKVMTGFQTPEGDDFNQRVNQANKEIDAYTSKINKAMGYLVDGNYEKFNETIEKENLRIPDVAARMKSYNTPLDQRIFEKMPLDLKVKYYEVFNPQ